MNRFTQQQQQLIYNASTVDKIKKYLNEDLDYNFRTYPYDLNHPSDLVELINMTLLEYLDMIYYISLFEHLYESIDKTLLICNTPLYANLYIDAELSPSKQNNLYPSVIDELKLIIEQLSTYNENLYEDLIYLFEKLFSKDNKEAFYLFWGFEKLDINKKLFLNKLPHYGHKFINTNSSKYICCEYKNCADFINFIKKEELEVN